MGKPDKRVAGNTTPICVPRKVHCSRDGFKDNNFFLVFVVPFGFAQPKQNNHQIFGNRNLVKSSTGLRPRDVVGLVLVGLVGLQVVQVRFPSKTTNNSTLHH